jgi:hypothetical protein
MPYAIVPVNSGFKVKKKQVGKPRFFSKKPLTKETATKQLRALYRSENIQKGNGCGCHSKWNALSPFMIK